MKLTCLRTLAVTIVLFGFNAAALAQTWVPLSLATDSQLRITAGSALDFSTMFAPTDMNRPIRISSGTGQLAEKGGAVQRYLCAPMMFTETHGLFPEPAEAEEMAVQLRRHGYNLVRIHQLDAALMSANDSTAVDYGFSPTQIANFKYFLQQLKLNSIRWIIDVNTSQYGAFGELAGTRSPNRNHPLYGYRNLNLELHYDDAAGDPRSAVNHWKGLVDRMINLPLPGGSILSDNATVALTLSNELGLNFNLNKVDDYPEPLATRFMAATGATAVPPIKMNKAEHGNDLVLQDLAKKMQSFTTQTEANTAAWMKSYLTTPRVENGVTIRPAYLGLTTTYNNGKMAQSYAARFDETLVSVHEYYAASLASVNGESLEIESSYADALPYVGYFGLVRVLNKPLIVDEHHHPYWSPYRRESGLAFPAYAAFQGYDGICRFANPVYLEYEANSPIERRRSLELFNVGFDPVSRAGETLSALLFRRGDVKRATYRAPAVLTDGFLHNAWSGRTPAPYGFSRLALVTGLGAVKEGYLPGSKDVDPFVLTETSLNGAATGSIQRTLWANTLASLKTKQAAKGWPVNTSDAVAQKYVTDTGEIELDAVAKKLVVKTPRTEAAVFYTLGEGIALTSLRIASADSGALVAASSLIESRALKDSSRILLIVATDARSSNAVFTTLDNGRVELTERGNMPVEIRAINLSLVLKHTGVPTGFKLYALSLAGDRIAELPYTTKKLTSSTFEFLLSIDTAQIRDAQGNPRITTYFELVKE